MFKKREHAYVDLLVIEAKPSRLKKHPNHYRICSVTKRGQHNYINLKLPLKLQARILQAYAQGKKVRIFAQ